MRRYLARLNARVWTPLGILCILMFLVLPIIIATPLVIWLTRQMDRLPRWNRPVDPGQPVRLRLAESSLGHQHVGLVGKVPQEPILVSSRTTGAADSQPSGDRVSYPFAQAPVGGELSAVDRQ